MTGKQGLQECLHGAGEIIRAEVFGAVKRGGQRTAIRVDGGHA